MEQVTFVVEIPQDEFIRWLRNNDEWITGYSVPHEGGCLELAGPSVEGTTATGSTLLVISAYNTPPEQGKSGPFGTVISFEVQRITRARTRVIAVLKTPSVRPDFEELLILVSEQWPGALVDFPPELRRKVKARKDISDPETAKTWEAIEPQLRSMLAAASPLRIDAPMIDDLLLGVKATATREYDSSKGTLFDFCEKVARRMYLGQIAATGAGADRAEQDAQDERAVRQGAKQLSEQERLDKALADHRVPSRIKKRRRRVWYLQKQGDLVETIANNQCVSRSTIQRDLRWLTDEGLL